MSAILEHAHTGARCRIICPERPGRPSGTSDYKKQLGGAAGVRPQFSQRKTLDERAGEGNHQGVYLIVTPGRAWQENDLPELVEKAGQKALFFSARSQVTDPHNLGALLAPQLTLQVRQRVVVPKDKAAGLTSVARKVASGAAEVVPLVVCHELGTRD